MMMNLVSMPVLPALPKGVLSADYQAILTIHEQIMARLDKPMPTIEQLAKKANMSSTKFRSLFKKMYGTSIYQYHLSARLTRSKELLEANEFTISQIAYKVGFSHPPAFVNIFHKHFGVFPAAFREQFLHS